MINFAEVSMNDLVRECVRIEMELEKLKRLWNKEFELANKDMIAELKMLREVRSLRIRG